MKKSFYYLTLFVALMMGATVFSSCDDDSEQPLPPEPDGIVYFAWDDAENKLVKKYYTEHIDTLESFDSETIPGGWYYVKDYVEMHNFINVLGDIHLILADGARMDVQGTITGQTGKENIYIYAQSEYPEKKPQITINSIRYYDYNGVNGNVTVNGGIVNVNSCNYGVNGNVTVNGGIVNVNSRNYAVHGNLTVYNGYVELNGIYGVGGDLIVKGCHRLLITGKERAVCGTIFFEVPYMFLFGSEDMSFDNHKVSSGMSVNYKHLETRDDAQGVAARRY